MRKGKLFPARTRPTRISGIPPFGARRQLSSPWQDTLFHHCQHGGHRAKLTRLRHNIPLMSELALLCPGESPEHRHLPWTRGPEGFATAEEKVYPLVLCRRIADIVRGRSAAAMGIALPPLALEPGASAPAHEAQAAAGRQPAGKKLPPLGARISSGASASVSSPSVRGPPQARHSLRHSR